MLILDAATIKNLRDHGMPAEQEIVVRHFLYFGPLSEGQLNHVADEMWHTLFTSAASIAEEEAIDDPDAKFERWPKDIAPHLTPEAKDMIIKMTRLDPAERATIDEVLEHPWWSMGVHNG